jgi:hypothetical protein
MSASTKQPARIWYLLPVLVALLAPVPVPFAIWHAATDKSVDAFQFKAPGSREFAISRPGKYVLWHETETVFDGQTYSSSGNLPPGLRVELLDLDTQTNIPLTPDQSTTMSSGATSRRSFGDFDNLTPGRYRITVSGQFPDQIFYFRESLTRRFGIVLKAMRLTALIWLAALGVAMFIFVRRSVAA